MGPEEGREEGGKKEGGRMRDFAVVKSMSWGKNEGFCCRENCIAPVAQGHYAENLAPGSFDGMEGGA